MSNETIRKKWDNLLNSFNKLLKSTEQNKNSYFVKFFKEEKKLINFYRNKISKNKINFNDVKKELNLDLDFSKLKECVPMPSNFSIALKKYRESLNFFILKTKTISPSIISNTLFKRGWRSFEDLSNIIKIIDETKYDSSIINKLFFKELYSILDRTAVEFCEIKARENIKNITWKNLEKIHNDDYVYIFLTNFIKLKTNKYKFTILKSYSEKNNEIVWENKENPFFLKLNFNPLWKDITNMRNDLEHSISTFLYINNEEKHWQLIANIELLIGFNFYLISELDNFI
ncbi:MAG: hypothetical protein ACRC8P_00325 [Spiroplasma sp.]